MSVHNPERAIVGNCPRLRRRHRHPRRRGTWPLATCPCGWRGGVDEPDNATVAERGSLRPVKERG